jgi:hypothetical protein
MNTKQLLIDIQSAFDGVQLEEGISWSEAAVLDGYGTDEQRVKARLRDVKDNWKEVPFAKISAFNFQDNIPFLDVKGLKYYLAPIMCYGIQHYKSNESLLLNGLIYGLTKQPLVNDLKMILNEGQKKCIIKYLMFCDFIGNDYFDTHKLSERINKYWLN